MDIKKNGSEWLSHSEEERREWFLSVVGVVAKIGECEDIKIEDALNQVEDFYSDSANVGELVQEVIAQAIRDNVIR